MAEEIRCEYTEREEGKTEDLVKLSNEIIPYDMKHNAENWCVWLGYGNWTTRPSWKICW